jgi:UDPglucose--hexose-1-phosphate uridylyltransferase
MKSPKEHTSAPTSEIRKHYYLDSYVVMAANRMRRPDAFTHNGMAHKVANPTCHFCNNSEPSLWQKPRGKDWQVKVIGNAFSALATNNPKAYGSQEVIINTPSHELEFSELPVEHIEVLFDAYRNRLLQLNKLDGIRYVLIFKNDGPLAGASVAHAHCQVLALPFVPPAIEVESDALNHYWDDKHTCAYCDILSWESAKRVRIIAEDKHFVALSPYASAYPLEVWLIPRRHESFFANLRVGELHSLAVILKKLAAKLDSSSISFNYFLQESLSDQDHHFVLKIEPRTTKWGGAELGTGVIINEILPEYATLWYQGKV